MTIFSPVGNTNLKPMGNKGSKTSEKSIQKAEMITDILSVFDDITSKQMFGGHGLFSHGKMFGMVDPEGVVYFKVGDSNRDDYEKEGSSRHSRMPYYKVPIKILANKEDLVKWADKSITEAKLS